MQTLTRTGALLLAVGAVTTGVAGPAHAVDRTEAAIVTTYFYSSHAGIVPSF